MITFFIDNFTYYMNICSDYPWWVIFICVALHIYCFFKCISMDNGDLTSSKNTGHNTVHTLFWLIVIVILPVLGPILYLIFSVGVYNKWAKKVRITLNASDDKEKKIIIPPTFNFNCKLFLGSAKLFPPRYSEKFIVRVFKRKFFTLKHLNGYDRSTAQNSDPYDPNAEGKKEISVRTGGSFFVLCILFWILIVVSFQEFFDISNNYQFEKVMERVVSLKEHLEFYHLYFKYNSLECALFMYLIIIVHDWFYNFSGKKIFFRILRKNGKQPWSKASPILGKLHFVEYDYCSEMDENTIREKTGDRSLKLLSPEDLVHTVRKITPEFFNRFSLVSTASKCSELDGCMKIKGAEDYIVEFLDPTYNYDLLDVKTVEKLLPLYNVTRYVYLDWYHGNDNTYVNCDDKENFTGYKEDEDVRCLERTIYSISPSIKLLLRRALVHLSFVVMLFTPILFSFAKYYVSLIDSFLHLFLK